MVFRYPVNLEMIYPIANLPSTFSLNRHTAAVAYEKFLWQFSSRVSFNIYTSIREVLDRGVRVELKQRMSIIPSIFVHLRTTTVQRTGMINIPVKRLHGFEDLRKTYLPAPQFTNLSSPPRAGILHVTLNTPCPSFTMTFNASNFSRR